MIDVAMLEGKEELTLVQYMLKCVFDGYDPSKKYRVTCGNNEYNRADGMFPDKFNKQKNRRCILCSKYGLENSRSRYRHPRTSKDVWVHLVGLLLLAGADGKNLTLQSNLKHSYCWFCKFCFGKKGEECGWVKAILNGTTYEERTWEEMCAASDEFQSLYHQYEMSLKRGEIEFQDGEHAPIRDSEKFTYFKKTKSYTQEFKPKFLEYRGSLPHHF